MRLKIRLRWSNNGLHYPFVTLVMIGKRSCPGRLTAAAGQACLLGISFGLPPRELPKRDLPVRAVSNTGMRLQREEDEALSSPLPPFFAPSLILLLRDGSTQMRRIANSIKCNAPHFVSLSQSRIQNLSHHDGPAFSVSCDIWMVVASLRWMR